MQDLLNEKVEAANTVIKDLSEDTDKEVSSMNPLSKLSLKKSRKRTKKKSKSKKGKSK